MAAKFSLKRLTVLFCSVLLVSSLFTTSAKAYGPRDPKLEEGDVLNIFNPIDVFNESTIKGDFTYTNIWGEGIDYFSDGDTGHIGEGGHAGYLDYRIETSTPLYKTSASTGLFVLRTQGYISMDESFGDSWGDDSIIDLPELFFVNVSDLQEDGKYILKTVFGKVAHRRALNRLDMADNPFDIGESPVGGLAGGLGMGGATMTGVGEFNSLGLMNGLNEEREGYRASNPATGSYGFVLDLKNHEDDGSVFSRWGIIQAFLVARMDPFDENWYMATEINKDWNYDDYAGRFNYGIVYGDGGAFRMNEKDSGVLMYASAAQKLDWFTPYVHFGNLWSNNGAEDITIQEFRIGAQVDMTDTDRLYSDLAMINYEDLYDSYVWFNAIRHKFNDNFNASFFVAPIFEKGDEPDIAIGFSGQAVL
jgi:hypothetical protein